MISKNWERMHVAFALVALALGTLAPAAGCSPAGQGAAFGAAGLASFFPDSSRPIAAVAPLGGRVDWESGRQTLAVPGEIVTRSTVQLIDLDERRTVRTALSDASGAFNLGTLDPREVPPTHAYTLEAIKGLGNNAAGREAVRLRINLLPRSEGGAIVEWRGPIVTADGGLLINYSSTAIAVAQSYRSRTDRPLDLEKLVGSVEAKRRQDSPAPATPDWYTPPESGGLTLQEFHDLWEMTYRAVATDRDPVESIEMDPGQMTFSLPAGLVRVDRLDPASGQAGTVVVVEGVNFAPTPLSANQVFFGPVAATPLEASQTLLKVVVPAGAASGPVIVRIGRLAGVGPEFSVR